MSFSAGLGSLFGAFGGKITERDAIMQAQPKGQKQTGEETPAEGEA